MCTLEGTGGKTEQNMMILLVYVDDVLAVRQLTKSIIKDIGLEFDIKYNMYGTPIDYLGVNVEPFQMSDVKYAWIIK